MDTNKLAARLVLYVAFGVLAFPSQTGRPVPPEPINSVRPLRDAAELLQSHYGQIVTYEESIILYRPDLAVYGKNKNVKWALGPRRRLFSLAPVAGIWNASALDGPLLSKVVNAYNQQNDGLHFRTEISKLGLHIIPSRSRDENGADVTVSPLLDAQITVPVERRTIHDSLNVLAEAVSLATGIRLEANDPSIRPYALDHMFAGVGDPFLTWGVETPTKARTALIDLLERSASSLSWRLLCQASAKPEDRSCALNITPVQLDVTDRYGKWVKKALVYDRCVVCPKMLPYSLEPPPE
jgi:hypothetical protein